MGCNNGNKTHSSIKYVMKSVAGLFVAPLAPVLLWVVLSIWQTPNSNSLTDLGSTLVVTYMVSFLSVLFVGLPIVEFLKSHRLFSMPFLLAGGVVGGILCWVIFIWLFSYLLESRLNPNLYLFYVGGGYGFITSLL